MKAVIKTKNGVEFVEKAIPTPKTGELCIKVVIAGFCRTDAYVAQNKIITETPLVLGHEFSGVIDEVGKGVSSFTKGDRVAVMPIAKEESGGYKDDMIGVHRDGAFAEYVCVPEEMVYAIPVNLSFQLAAYAEPIAASLAVVKAPITKDQTGIVLGDNRIADLTIRVAKAVDTYKMEKVAKEKIEQIESNSFDYAIETLTDDASMRELVRIVRPGGVIVLKSRSFEPTKLLIKEIVRKELTMVGTFYGDFGQALELLSSDKLSVEDIFGPKYPLEKAVVILQSDTGSSDEKKIFFNISESN